MELRVQRVSGHLAHIETVREPVLILNRTDIIKEFVGVQRNIFMILLTIFGRENSLAYTEREMMMKMKVYLKLLVGLLLIFTLSGCIGEDYDAGPPGVDMILKEDIVSLKEANIDWQTHEKLYKKETKDILTLGSKQKRITVQPNQLADLVFQENKENGGDYTDEVVNVSVWKGDKEADLEYNGNSFYFPKETGNYVLEVEFKTRKGTAQYVGNIVIK